MYKRQNEQFVLGCSEYFFLVYYMIWLYSGYIKVGTYYLQGLFTVCSVCLKEQFMEENRLSLCCSSGRRTVYGREQIKFMLFLSLVEEVCCR